MQNLYLIPGLGADQRVFEYLEINNYNLIHINWEAPKRRENLQAYAKRLIAQIDLSLPVYLLGVSFGGIVAQEISRLIKVEKLVIISSVKSFKEYGFNLKLASYFQIHKITPVFILKFLNLITANYFFGISNQKDAKLLKSIIQDTDDQFMLWAINQIMLWKPTKKLNTDYIHIQGSSDRIFTNKKLNNVHWIENGGHFMIVDKCDQVSDLVNSFLLS